MIKERHMKQGRRLDNGELVQGYFMVTANEEVLICQKSEPMGCGYCNQEFWHDGGCGGACEVEPASVEDVAVEPIEDSLTQSYQCPNCEAGITCENYCYNCGQRIGWK